MATFVSPHLVKRRVLNSFVQYIQRTGNITSQSKMAQSNAKPPNILVYKPKSVTFPPKNNPITILERYLPRNQYVVYELPFERAPTDPWMDNCQLLIIPGACKMNPITENPTISKTEVVMFEKYISGGGKVINFNENVMEQVSHMGKKAVPSSGSGKITDKDGAIISEECTTWKGNVIEIGDGSKADTVLSVQHTDVKKEPIAVCFTDKNCAGKMLHCTLPVLTCGEGVQLAESELEKILNHLLTCMDIMKEDAHSDTIPQHTPCFLLCQDREVADKFLAHLGVKLGGVGEVKGQVTLIFTPVTKDPPQATAASVPVLYLHSGEEKGSASQYGFDFAIYAEHLLSEEYGRTLIYADVVSSTMDIMEPLVTKVPNDTSVTCIARQQLSGKGRGGNKWISPAGTAMFSLMIAIPMASRLGQHLPLLQHMVTVAVVRAVRSMPGLDGIDLRVKWPNDIYFGTGVKIGGVIVKSTIFRDQCIATIGCGVNVENESPTTCINTVVQSVYPDHRRLSCEEVLARSLTSLEQLIAKYQKEGPEQFLAFYYKYWIHGDMEVKVQLPMESSKPEGIATNGTPDTVDTAIVGLDTDGFLRVTVKDGHKMAGQIISLQPDSNSFDITKNLIAMKVVH